MRATLKFIVETGFQPEIERALASSGLGAGTPEALPGQLAAYLSLLLAWNRRMNLTSLTDPAEIVARHFLESLFAAQHVPTTALTLLDFGSGAGFPGLPIALARPALAVTLAEAHGRKAAFLREAVRTLGSPANVEIYAGRVEAMPPGRRFDVVTMRAVEKTPAMVPLALARAVDRLLLLTAERAAEALPRAGVAWDTPLTMPGGDRRALWIGHPVR